MWVIESMGGCHRSRHKTQPVCERNFASAIRIGRKFTQLVRRRQAVLAVPPAQFIHQVLEVGREARRRTQALLQMFTYGVANRSARLAIALSAVVCDSAIHDEFRFLSVLGEA